MEVFSNFSVIQFAAHPARDERLNVGIVVFHPDHIDVRISKRLERLRAISAAIDTEQVKESADNLKAIDEFVRSQGFLSIEDRIEKISGLTGFNLSAHGEFQSSSSFEYDNAIASLLQKLVEPEPAPARLLRARSSRLLTTLKKAFKDERILALKGETIDSHRVVANHKIVDGLAANLVLRNGAMHIFETIDAADDETSQLKIFKDIGYSTLVFEQARMTYGEGVTRAKLVYQASTALEKIAKPGLDAAAHQGAELINWESHDDRIKFITTVASLAEPVPDKKARPKQHSLHASTQQKFHLN